MTTPGNLGHDADTDPEANGRLDIGAVLPGVQLHPLEADEANVATIDDVFVLVKYSDASGETTWAYRTNRAPNKEELLGALTVQVRLLERELLADWEDD